MSLPDGRFPLAIEEEARPAPRRAPITAPPAGRKLCSGSDTSKTKYVRIAVPKPPNKVPRVDASFPPTSHDCCWGKLGQAQTDRRCYATEADAGEERANGFLRHELTKALVGGSGSAQQREQEKA